MRHQEPTSAYPAARPAPDRHDEPPALLALRRLPTAASPAGDAVTYGVAVRNAGPDLPLWVRLEHELPPDATHLASEPPAQIDGDVAVWDLGRLDPADETMVMIVLAADSAGFDDAATQFRAVFKKPAPASLSVTLPPIAPVAPGETTTIVIEVANGGGRPARDVHVWAALPDGVRREFGHDLDLTHPVIQPLGNLRLVTRVTGVEPGDHPFTVLVTTPEGQQSQANAAIRVTAPRLAVRIHGPARCELGRHAEYRAEVVNDGTGTAAHVRVRCAWPEELCFVSASAAGGLEPDGMAFDWSVGDLEPGAASVATLTFAPRLPGDVGWRAAAVAENARGCEANMTTNIGFSSDGSDAVSPSNLLGDLLQKVDRAAANGQRDAAEAVRGRGRGDGEEHVVFALAGTDYAVPISNVLEIGRPLPITPVPNVPDWVLGVANVRGDIVSMIDLRQFLGVSRGEAGPNGRLIVVRGTAEAVVVGLRVDQVKGIRGIQPDAVLPPTGLAEGGATPYLKGLTERDDSLLAVLDLDRLLASQ